ncbi:hypothetical protein F2Q68_00010624 [Brassica cretica]|uniref:Uncharacterized protein n=1 Tax=Brassica cretica TaxID=69181 RepID=A0A8S9L2A9_BRACR|nr:hypothetical protein F2Q68_00010624 [Brassica cretica]
MVKKKAALSLAPMYCPTSLATYMVSFAFTLQLMRAHDSLTLSTHVDPEQVRSMVWTTCPYLAPFLHISPKHLQCRLDHGASSWLQTTWRGAMSFAEARNQVLMNLALIPYEIFRDLRQDGVLWEGLGRDEADWLIQIWPKGRFLSHWLPCIVPLLWLDTRSPLPSLYS